MIVSFTSDDRLDYHHDAEIVDYTETFDFEVCNHPSNTFYKHGDTLVFTRIPPNPYVPGSECLLPASFKHRIYSEPGFPSKIQERHDKESGPCYRIGNTEYIRVADTNMKTSIGKGMFATRSINAGDLILAERPLLVVPFNMRHTELWKLEKYLDAIVFQRLDAASRTEFERLHNEHCNDEEFEGLAYSGTVLTNGVKINVTEDSEDGFLLVMKDISRVNHSCIPNAKLKFDMPSFSFKLLAGAKIEAGEQIFRDYQSDCTATYNQRLENLSIFGINCQCPLCSLPEKYRIICDDFRSNLKNNIANLVRRVENYKDTVLLDERLYNNITMENFMNEAKMIYGRLEYYGMLRDRNEHCVNVIKIIRGINRFRDIFGDS